MRKEIETLISTATAYENTREILRECLQSIIDKQTSEKSALLLYAIGLWSQDIAKVVSEPDKYRVRSDEFKHHFRMLFEVLDFESAKKIQGALLELVAYPYLGLTASHFSMFDFLYNACDYEIKRLEKVQRDERKAKRYKTNDI